MAPRADFNLSLKGSFTEAADSQNPDHRHQTRSVSLKTFAFEWLRHLPPTPLLVFSASPSLLLYHLTGNLPHVRGQSPRTSNPRLNHLDARSEFLRACRPLQL